MDSHASLLGEEERIIDEMAAAIQSDVLAQWHVILRELPVLARIVGVPGQLRLVIDANIVIAEVRWMVKKRSKSTARTALQEAIASNTVVAFAPPFLRSEVEKRLHTIASAEGLSIDALFAAWRSYSTLLRFVQPPSLPATSKQAALRDPNDTLYLELQVGIDAAAVYTEDPDLRAMGAPVVGRNEVRSAVTFARAASISFTFRISGAVVLIASIETVRLIWSALRAATRAVRRLPEWVQWLLLGAVCILLALPRSRAWLRERIANLGSAAWTLLRHSVPLLASAIERTAVSTGVKLLKNTGENCALGEHLFLDA